MKLKNAKLHFKLQIRSRKIKSYTLSYLLKVEKYLNSLQVTNSVVKLLCFCFRVTKSRLKNRKMHFELLTQWVHFYYFGVTKVKLINEKIPQILQF